MKKRNFILKDFSKMYTCIHDVCVCVCVPSNLTKNAFEYSLFHTFEQQ